MSKANRIDHECVSMDSLVTFVGQRCGQENVKFEKVKGGEDPPDYWMFVNGRKFAVEETSIASEDTVKGIAVARTKGENVGSLGLKWEGEVQDELAALIQSAVRTKSET